MEQGAHLHGEHRSSCRPNFQHVIAPSMQHWLHVTLVDQELQRAVMAECDLSVERQNIEDGKVGRSEIHEPCNWRRTDKFLRGITIRESPPTDDFHVVIWGPQILIKTQVNVQRVSNMSSHIPLFGAFKTKAN